MGISDEIKAATIANSIDDTTISELKGWSHCHSIKLDNIGHAVTADK